MNNLHEIHFAREPNCPVIWNVLDGAGTDVGLITNFPGEGPKVTIRAFGLSRTMAFSTVESCTMAAALTYEELVDEGSYYDDEHIPDEDGSQAFAAMLERRAEYGRDFDDCPW